MPDICRKSNASCSKAWKIFLLYLKLGLVVSVDTEDALEREDMGDGNVVVELIQ